MGNELTELKELNNLYTQINQISGGKIGSQTFANGKVSFNDVAWFSNAVQGLGSDSTPEQKASAIQQLVQQALSIFEKFANQEAQAARKEVAQETKKSEELVKKSKEVGVELEGKFTEIASSVDSQTGIVNEAIDLIAKTQKSLEKKQKQVEELIKEIEAKQNELKEAKTQDDQASILGEIQGLAKNIADIGLTIEEDNKTLQNLTKAVANTKENIDESTKKMTVVEEDGKGKIQQLGQQAQQNTTEVTQTATTGGVNKATGKGAEEAAEAASSNLFTGASLAPKLQQLAFDQNTAADERLRSIVGNINTIAQGIVDLQNASGIVGEFTSTIGSSLDNYATQIGSWGTAVSPVITSLGSFSLMSAGLEELNNAVETDLTTIGETPASENNVSKTETPKTAKTDNDAKEQDPQNNSNNLLTPQFDVKKLRTFGI